MHYAYKIHYNFIKIQKGRHDYQHPTMPANIKRQEGRKTIMNPTKGIL
jgi:hypothetical protein